MPRCPAAARPCLAPAIALLLALPAAAQGPASAPASAPVDPAETRTVATVGDTVITLGQLRQVLKASGRPPETWEVERPLALGKLIFDALRDFYVASQKITVDEQAFEAFFTERMDTLRKQGIDVEAIMAQRGVTLDQVRAEERRLFAFQAALRPMLAPASVARVIEQIRPYANGDQITVRQLVIGATPTDDARRHQQAKARLAKIKEQVTSGQISFEDAARRYSEDDQGAEQGGLISQMPFSPMAERLLPFAMAAFSAKPGEVIGPIQTMLGHHLLVVEDHLVPTSRPASQPVLDELAKRIIQQNGVAMVLVDMSAQYPVTWADYTERPLVDRPLKRGAATQPAQPAKPPARP